MGLEERSYKERIIIRLEMRCELIKSWTTVSVLFLGKAWTCTHTTS